MFRGCARLPPRFFAIIFLEVFVLPRLDFHKSITIFIPYTSFTGIRTVDTCDVEYNKRDMLIIMPHSLSRAHADQHEQTDAQPRERDRDTRAMDTVT